MRKTLLTVGLALIACLLVMLWTTKHFHYDQQSTVDVPVGLESGNARHVACGSMAGPTAVQNGAGVASYGTQPFRYVQPPYVDT